MIDRHIDIHTTDFQVISVDIHITMVIVARSPSFTDSVPVNDDRQTDINTTDFQNIDAHIPVTGINREKVTKN